ncbi:MAG: transglycosylase domain-containing protein [Acidobacteriota bacterium]
MLSLGQHSLRRCLLSLAFASAAYGLAAAASAQSSAARLELEVGRSETRVYSSPTPLDTGKRVGDLGVARRFDRLGYRRVRGRRPSVPGEYFWGFDHFWVYQRAHLVSGQKAVPAALWGLELKRPHGEIVGVVEVGPEGDPVGSSRRAYVEPELLFESLTERRAPRVPVELEALPDVVWQAVIAAEDGRFFDHRGVDGRGIARALLRNARAGQVKQGGSTITQQLIKVRELTPKRTLGRKVSEGLRALALEAEHSKEEILQAYLNSVYFGAVENVSLYGIGAAARGYFGVEATELTLEQASVLAGIIQSPNRLTPARHREAARERQSYVLGRMKDLGFITTAQADAASLPKVRARQLSAGPTTTLRNALRTVVEDRSDRLGDGRGIVVRTALDPWLQEVAEKSVADLLRRFDPESGVSAALVAARISDGRIVAYVGGDPNKLDGFDRVQSKRQPGSTVKPFVVVEALDRCGEQDELHLATRVRDEKLTLELPSGPWTPRNSKREFRGVVDLRGALVDSLNVPTVRVARHCGFDVVAERFEAFGLDLPAERPPSFVLGSVETSPVDLLSAYLTLAAQGKPERVVLVDSLELPGGRRLGSRFGQKRGTRRPVRSSTAHIVRRALEDVTWEWGPEGSWGKTGTSSRGRDAWFAGGSGDLVVVVWVGADRGRGLGLSGRGTAAPIFQEFASKATASYPAVGQERPKRVVEHWLDEETGLIVKYENSRARRELFRRGHMPPRRRLLLPRSVPILE